MAKAELGSVLGLLHDMQAACCACMSKAQACPVSYHCDPVAQQLPMALPAVTLGNVLNTSWARAERTATGQCASSLGASGGFSIRQAGAAGCRGSTDAGASNQSASGAAHGSGGADCSGTFLKQETSSGHATRPRLLVGWYAWQPSCRCACSWARMHCHVPAADKEHWYQTIAGESQAHRTCRQACLEHRPAGAHRV